MQSLWMLLACAMFAMMGAFIKVAADLGATLPEIVLFRGIPSVLLLFFWARSTRRTLRPTRWGPHIWRNVSGIVSMWMGFFALSHLALATAVSLNYTAPLFIAGWLLFFGEPARPAWPPPHLAGPSRRRDPAPAPAARPTRAPPAPPRRAARGGGRAPPPALPPRSRSRAGTKRQACPRNSPPTCAGPSPGRRGPSGLRSSVRDPDRADDGLGRGSLTGPI